MPILVLFVLAFPISLTLRSVGNLLFEANTTKSLVRQSLLNSELGGRLARRGAEQILGEQGGDPSAQDATSQILANLTEEDWREITELIAPEDLVSQTLDKVVDAFSEWLNTPKADFPDLNLDISSWKSNAVKQASAVATVVLDALPDCDVAQVTDMTQRAAQDPASILEALPACKPPDPFYSQIIDRADRVMTQIVSGVPDVVDLSRFTQGKTAPAELVSLRGSMLLLRTWLTWGWALVLGVALLAAILAASDLKSFLAWFGWPLVAAGLVTVLLAFLMLIFRFEFLDQLMASSAGQQNVALQALLGALSGGALRLVAGPVILEGAIAALVGSGAVLYGRVLDRREKSPGIPLNRRKIGL